MILSAKEISLVIAVISDAGVHSPQVQAGISWLYTRLLDLIQIRETEFLSAALKPHDTTWHIYHSVELIDLKCAH